MSHISLYCWMDAPRSSAATNVRSSGSAATRACIPSRMNTLPSSVATGTWHPSRVGFPGIRAMPAGSNAAGPVRLHGLSWSPGFVATGTASGFSVMGSPTRDTQPANTRAVIVTKTPTQTFPMTDRRDDAH